MTNPHQYQSNYIQNIAKRGWVGLQTKHNGSTQVKHLLWRLRFKKVSYFLSRLKLWFKGIRQDTSLFTNTLKLVRQYPWPSRIFAVTFILLILMTIINLTWQLAATSKMSEKEQSLAEEIFSKRQQAVKKLTEGELTEARLIFSQSWRLAKRVPEKSKNYFLFQLLINDLESSRDLFFPFINLSQPQIQVDFSNLTQDPGQALILTDNQLFILTKNNYLLHNLATNKTDIVLKLEQPGSVIAAEPTNQGYLIIADKINGLLEWQLSENLLQSLAFKPAPENINLADLAIFNNRLYVLDQRARQIFRYIRLDNGYGQGEPWLKDKTVDLSQASQLAIDGSIYVALQNNSLTKFTAGQRVSFNQTTLLEPLTSIQELIVSLDNDLLIILDNQQKRLLVLNKNGDLKKEITAKQFSDLTDAVLDEKNNLIYLLSSTKVYRIPLELK